jgi:hypothetical protein
MYQSKIMQKWPIKSTKTSAVATKAQQELFSDIIISTRAKRGKLRV